MQLADDAMREPEDLAHVDDILIIEGIAQHEAMRRQGNEDAIGGRAIDSEGFGQALRRRRLVQHQLQRGQTARERFNDVALNLIHHSKKDLVL